MNSAICIFGLVLGQPNPGCSAIFLGNSPICRAVERLDGRKLTLQTWAAISSIDQNLFLKDLVYPEPAIF